MRRGFTLLEALVAAALAGAGIAAVLGGFAALGRTEARVREAELMQRLAVQKLEELVATGEWTLAPLSGDFAESNREGYDWSLELTPTGIENLDSVSVTVTSRINPLNPQRTVGALQFRPPLTGGGLTP